MWDLRKHYSLYKKKPIPVDQIQYPGSSFTQVQYQIFIWNSYKLS